MIRSAKMQELQFHVAFILSSFHTDKRKFERDEYHYYLYEKTSSTELNQNRNEMNNEQKQEIIDSFTTISNYDRDQFLDEFIKLDYGTYAE